MSPYENLARDPILGEMCLGEYFAEGIVLDDASRPHTFMSDFGEIYLLHLTDRMTVQVRHTRCGHSFLVLYGVLRYGRARCPRIECGR